MSSLSGFVTTSVVVSEDGLELKENNLESNKVTGMFFRIVISDTFAFFFDQKLWFTILFVILSSSRLHSQKKTLKTIPLRPLHSSWRGERYDLN